MLQGALDDVRSKAGPRAAGSAPRPEAAPAGATVSGTVAIDASLKGRVGAGDTLMVIARVPGSRMPVAVVRVSAGLLPYQYTLDDSVAMSPQARISSTPEVEVEARISKSGQAKAEAGDLVSAVQTVKVGARGVAINVAEVRR